MPEPTTTTEPPAVVVHVGAALEVVLPVRDDLDVDLAVVLHRDAGRRVGQVVLADDLTALVADREVDLRLRQPGEDEQHPQAGLHGGVDVASYELGGGQRLATVAVPALPAGSHQLLRRVPSPAHQPVADHHEVDERELTTELDEHLHVAGDAYALLDHHSRRVTHVAADAPVVAAELLMPDAHVLVGDRRDRGALRPGPPMRGWPTPARSGAPARRARAARASAGWSRRPGRCGTAGGSAVRASPSRSGRARGRPRGGTAGSGRTPCRQRRGSGVWPARVVHRPAQRRTRVRDVALADRSRGQELGHVWGWRRVRGVRRGVRRQGQVAARQSSRRRAYS